MTRLPSITVTTPMPLMASRSVIDVTSATLDVHERVLMLDSDIVSEENWARLTRCVYKLRRIVAGERFDGLQLRIDDSVVVLPHCHAATEWEQCGVDTRALSDLPDEFILAVMPPAYHC